MKKKAWLGLACAGVMVAATSTSYALWDQLEDSKSTNITFTRIMVQAQDLTLSKASTLADGTPVYSGTFTVDVTGVEDLSKKKLDMTPSMMLGDTDVLANADVAFTQEGDTLSSAAGATTDTNLTEANAYTVTVTPKSDEASVNALTNAGGTVTLTLHAKLSDQN